MIRLLVAILGVAVLLSCSGEGARVKAEALRGADQTGSAAIEFAPPSPETVPGSQSGEQIRLGYEVVVNTQEYARPYVGNRLSCTVHQSLEVPSGVGVELYPHRGEKPS